MVGGREAAGECDAVILLMCSLLRRPLLVESDARTICLNKLLHNVFARRRTWMDAKVIKYPFLDMVTYLS